ncbi:MAG: cobalamin biosynthesis protein [Syntrophales bacterium]|nr:cobalamin biosynthesis protein [Syntrophales bacterium]
MSGLIILLAALLLDIAAGEAPNRFHPVAWLGNFIALLLKIRPYSGTIRQFVYGAAIVVMTILVITLPFYFLLSFLQNFNAIIYIALSAYLLKNTFSLRGLWQAVQKVKLSLQSAGLAAARSNVRALVQRDPEPLDERQLISAAIESCAENLCDSFVAPLFYYAIFGLPGALVYRTANTFDAMIGYHGEWEYTGKFAARFDDILNFIPARLSGLIILVGAAICRTNPESGWRAMLAYHAATESPNAGWTMSAMAGSLDIVLEKTGHYRLGNGEQELSLTAISESQMIVLSAASIWALLVIGKEAIVAAVS